MIVIVYLFAGCVAGIIIWLSVRGQPQVAHPGASWRDCGSRYSVEPFNQPSM